MRVKSAKGEQRTTPRCLVDTGAAGKKCAKGVRTAVDRFPLASLSPELLLHKYSSACLTVSSPVIAPHTDWTALSHSVLRRLSVRQRSRALCRGALARTHTVYGEIYYGALSSGVERFRDPFTEGVVNREPTACPSPRNFRKTKKGTGAPRRVLAESIRPNFVYRRLPRNLETRYIYHISFTDECVCVLARRRRFVPLSHPRVFCVQLLLLSRRRSHSLSLSICAT